MTINLYVFLLELQRVTSGNQNLLFNKVDASDGLSYGMFNLKTSVHLQEVEIFLAIHEELNRTGGVIVTASCKRYRLVAHFFSCDSVHCCRWCLFDNFLVSSLN